MNTIQLACHMSPIKDSLALEVQRMSRAVCFPDIRLPITGCATSRLRNVYLSHQWLKQILQYGRHFETDTLQNSLVFASSKFCKLTNSLNTSVLICVSDGWFAHASDTNDPDTIFLLYTSRAANVIRESVLDFFVHMAGKHGRLRTCIDSLHRCPFERTGKELSISTRRWTNFRIDIPQGYHMVSHLVMVKSKRDRFT